MSTLATVAAREQSAREETAKRRLEMAVSTRNAPGVRGYLMVLALMAACLWYLWLGARGFWTHQQEPAVSAIQLAIALVACFMVVGNLAMSGWVLWANATVLAGVGALGVQLLRQQPPATARGWLAVGFSALCLHYLWQCRARFGPRADVKPFQTATPVRGGILEFLTGAARRENAVVAVNNAIAEAGSVGALPETVLVSIAAASGLGLETDLADEAAWLYRSYLSALMADPARTADAPGELARLAAELRLKDPVVKDAHAKVGGALYQAQLVSATADRSLSDEEKVGLAELQSRLSLSDTDVAQIQTTEQSAMVRAVFDEVNGLAGIDAEGQARILAVLAQVSPGAVTSGLGPSIYRARVEHVVEDGVVAESERASLDQLQAALNLSGATAKAIRQEKSRTLIQTTVDRVVRDGQLDEAESRELAELEERLGIDVRDDRRNRETLGDARTVWQIMHGTLPVVGTSVRLDDGEVCHAEREGAWHEWSSVDYGTTYRTRTSVRHVDGFLGPYDKVESDTEEIHDVRRVLLTIDTGRLLVTNQAIRWVGNKLNRRWDYGDLVDVTLDGDELVVHPDSGGNEAFKMTGETRLFRLIVGRALRDG